MIEILQPGITSIQDLGRPGWESSGMPRSGAFDPFLARVANQLAGNSHDTALLEFALVGPSLRFHKYLQNCVCRIFTEIRVRWKCSS